MSLGVNHICMTMSYYVIGAAPILKGWVALRKENLWEHLGFLKSRDPQGLPGEIRISSEGSFGARLRSSHLFMYIHI